jgi:hypothetical protein
MKQKDLALFAVVGIVSAVFSVILSGILITPPKNKNQKAEVVSLITDDFPTPAPNDKFFNKNSINPTKQIQIGDNTNTKPFNGTN